MYNNCRSSCVKGDVDFREDNESMPQERECFGVDSTWKARGLVPIQLDVLDLVPAGRPTQRDTIRSAD